MKQIARSLMLSILVAGSVANAMVIGKVTVIESDSAPDQIWFKHSAFPATNCGGYIRFIGTSTDNRKAVFAALMAAYLSSKDVALDDARYDPATCAVPIVLLQ